MKKKNNNILKFSPYSLILAFLQLALFIYCIYSTINTSNFYSFQPTLIIFSLAIQLLVILILKRRTTPSTNMVDSFLVQVFFFSLYVFTLCYSVQLHAGLIGAFVVAIIHVINCALDHKTKLALWGYTLFISISIAISIIVSLTPGQRYFDAVAKMKDLIASLLYIAIPYITHMIIIKKLTKKK